MVVMRKKRKNPRRVLQEVREPKYRQRVEKDRKKEQKKDPPWED